MRVRGSFDFTHSAPLDGDDQNSLVRISRASMRPHAALLTHDRTVPAAILTGVNLELLDQAAEFGRCLHQLLCRLLRVAGSP